MYKCNTMTIKPIRIFHKKTESQLNSAITSRINP